MKLFETEIITPGIKIEVINPIDDPKYYDYIMNHPTSTIYHHPLWKGIIEKAFKNYQVSYQVFLNEGEAMIGTIPGFVSGTVLSRGSFISLPMLPHCDPLFDNAEAMRLGLNALIRKQQEKRYKSIELRSISHYPVIPELNFQPLEQYVTHILKIDKDILELRNTFHKTSIQQRIRRAERDGLTVQLGSTKSDLEVFNHLLALTRRKLGLPPLPAKFFNYMWEFFYPERLFSLLMVFHKRRCISAMILLKFKNRVYSEYTGTDPKYLRLNPNQFIFWKAIELAHQEGYSEFDFGRTSLDNHGLIGFKKRWGAEQKQLYYYYFPELTSMTMKKRDSLKFKSINFILKRMPLKPLQWVGNFYFQYLN